LVNGYSKGVEVLRRGPPGVEALASEGRVFPYPLSETETVDLTRQTVTRLRLSRLLTARSDQSYDLQFLGVVHYPYWTLYTQAGDGPVRLRMLDALTGKPAGSLSRQALLDALAAEADRVRQ
jgi:hypothetical protein